MEQESCWEEPSQFTPDRMEAELTAAAMAWLLHKVVVTLKGVLETVAIYSNYVLYESRFFASLKVT